MSDTAIDLSFPLDEEGFFRRECPLCRREFKVQPTPEELRTLVASRHALAEADGDHEEERETSEDEDAEPCCPYCGQRASGDSWWTEEQLAYINTAAAAVAARFLNEQLRQTFGRSRGGFISVEVKEGPNPPEAWISPEPNDMERVHAPCCGRDLKLEEGWTSGTYCFYCGFPFRPAAETR